MVWKSKRNTVGGWEASVSVRETGWQMFRASEYDMRLLDQT